MLNVGCRGEGRGFGRCIIVQSLGIIRNEAKGGGLLQNPCATHRTSCSGRTTVSLEAETSNESTTCFMSFMVVQGASPESSLTHAAVKRKCLDLCHCWSDTGRRAWAIATLERSLPSSDECEGCRQNKGGDKEGEVRDEKEIEGFLLCIFLLFLYLFQTR